MQSISAISWVLFCAFSKFWDYPIWHITVLKSWIWQHILSDRHFHCDHQRNCIVPCLRRSILQRIITFHLPPDFVYPLLFCVNLSLILLIPFNRILFLAMIIKCHYSSLWIVDCLVYLNRDIQIPLNFHHCQICHCASPDIVIDLRCWKRVSIKVKPWLIVYRTAAVPLSCIIRVILRRVARRPSRAVFFP